MEQFTYPWTFFEKKISLYNILSIYKFFFIYCRRYLLPRYFFHKFLWNTSFIKLWNLLRDKCYEITLVHARFYICLSSALILLFLGSIFMNFPLKFCKFWIWFMREFDIFFFFECDWSNSNNFDNTTSMCFAVCVGLRILCHPSACKAGAG